MINHFASIYETKVACRNYLNIISPFRRGYPFSCSHACLRLYGSTYTTHVLLFRRGSREIKPRVHRFPLSVGSLL